MSGAFNPARRAEIRRIQDAIIAELVGAGTPKAAVAYVMRVLLAHDLTWAMISQRVRREQERRARVAHQASKKPQLREQAIFAFSATCAYCDREGTPEADPDGKAWELDRLLPGRLGGEYCAENVTLACHACNQRKGGSWIGRPPASVAEMNAAA